MYYAGDLAGRNPEVNTISLANDFTDSRLRRRRRRWSIYWRNTLGADLPIHYECHHHHHCFADAFGRQRRFLNYIRYSHFDQWSSSSSSSNWETIDVEEGERMIRWVELEAIIRIIIIIQEIPQKDDRESKKEVLSMGQMIRTSVLVDLRGKCNLIMAILNNIIRLARQKIAF